MKKSLWLSSIVLGLPIAASADFINPSFELPALTPGDAIGVSGNEQLPGWNLTFGVLTTNQYVGGNVNWNPTPDGNQFLYVNPNVGGGSLLSQSLTLTEGSHTLNFLQADFASQAAQPGGEIDVTVLDSSQNVIVGPQLFSTLDFSPYILQTLSFSVASAGTYEFDFTSEAGHAALIDGVHMDSVPEPAALIGLGIGLIGFGRKRSPRTR